MYKESAEQEKQLQQEKKALNALYEEELNMETKIKYTHKK